MINAQPQKGESITVDEAINSIPRFPERNLADSTPIPLGIPLLGIPWLERHLAA